MLSTTHPIFINSEHLKRHFTSRLVNQPISYIAVSCPDSENVMPSEKIQTFEPGDEAEIVDLFEAAFGESDYYFPRSKQSWIWRYIQRPGFDSESIFMIRKEDILVSALSMTYGTMIINREPKKVALIDDVSTHPNWRNQGFATALMTHAIGRAQEMNCWGVHLSADLEGSAIRIYKSIGFEIVTTCINMMSVLQHRRAARFGNRRQAIALIALSVLDAFKNMRIDKNLCQVESIERSHAADIVQRAQNEFELSNGTLKLDAEYVTWMTHQRPDGALKVLSLSKNDDFSGVLTVSSSDFSAPGAIDRLAAIGNLNLSESIWNNDEIASALYGAKKVAKHALDCPMVNMFVDQRDELLRKACKRAGFMEVGKSASMFHPLGESSRIGDIRQGVWSQPTETSTSNP